MSTISDAMGQALAAVGVAKGDALTYAATQAGSYSALSGFVIHVDRVQPATFSDDRNLEQQEETGTVKGPLLPALARGQYIKDTLNGDRVWLVEAVKVDQQQVARVRRNTQLDATPNRRARQ